MLLTLATIPEEPGSEAQELEKLSIRELQLRLSAEMARVAEVQLQESGGLGSSLVLHKCVVRGCISEPTGFGRGRQSSFLGSLGDGGKLDGCGLAVPSGDWMMLGRKTMNKSLALAEHWNVALGEWEDEAPAETSGGGATEVGGYLEYRVESEVVAQPMLGAQLADPGEERQSMSAVGEGHEEEDMRQVHGGQIPRRAELAAWPHSTHEFDLDGRAVEKSGELRMRASSGADISNLMPGKSSRQSETCPGNATDDEREGGRVLEGDSPAAVELRGTIEGSCLVEGVGWKAAEIQQGQWKTFLGIPRPSLVPSSKAELWDPSTPGPGRDSSNKAVDVLVDGSPHTALSLAVEDVVPPSHEPLSPVSVARQDLEGKKWQNDGQQVQEEGSRSGVKDHDMHRSCSHPGEPDVLMSVAGLDDHPLVERVVELACSDGVAMAAEKGSFPTKIMACAVISSQDLKVDNPTLAGVGSFCLPCEAVLESDGLMQSLEAPMQDQGATGISLVQASDVVSDDNSLQNYSSKDAESTSGNSGPSELSPSWNTGNEGYQVSEVIYSAVGDESFGRDSGLRNCEYLSPATDGDHLNSSPPEEDSPGLLSEAVVDESACFLELSVFADSGVRQVAERGAPGELDYAKDNAGTSKDSPVQALTTTEAACVTELVGDSSASHLTGFQADPHMDSSVRDRSLLDLNDQGYKSDPGLENPGEYTTLLEKRESKLRPSVTRYSSSQVSGGSSRGCDDEAMAQQKLLPHPRSPLLDLQDRVSFGAIGHTASDLRSDTTEELGEVTWLVDELLSDSLETRCRAAEKIRTLTKYNAKARTRMGQLDATDRSGRHSLIPALVAFLHSAVHHDHVDQSPPTLRKAQEMAACAILNLGINNDRNKGAIVSAGAVPELVELLRGNVGVRTKEAAIAALLTLSCLQENHAHMGSTRGTISQLVHVLRRGTKQACKDALTALNNLTASMGNRQRMVRAGAVRALTRLLATGDYGESPLPDAPIIQDSIIGEKCVGLLYNLSSSKEGREAILNTNGTLAVLCEIVDSELSTEKEKEHAASTLWNLCCNSAYHSQLVKDEGVTPALIALSVQGSVRAQEKARLLLAHLCTICNQQDEQGSVRSRTTGSFPRQLEPSLVDDGYVASESEKSVENYSSASESLCSTPASQPLRMSMQWSGPEVHYSAPLERTSDQHRDCKANSGTRRSLLGNLLRHINPLARHQRSASSFVPFGRKS